MSTQLTDERAMREEKYRKVRIDKVGRILKVLEHEFSTDEMAGIENDIWVAMQMICGPCRAALAIRSSQIN